jgi:hypothetical protein
MKNTLLSCFLLFILFSASAQDTTNRGTEFWVGYGHHQYMETTSGYSNDQVMTLYISTDALPATVIVTIDSSGTTPSDPTSWWQRTFIVPAYTTVNLQTTSAGVYSAGAGAVGEIPKAYGYDARLYSPPVAFGGTASEGIFRKRGIHIQSSTPVVAYAHIYGGVSSGAAMLVPLTAWGGEYVSVNSPQTNSNEAYSWLYIIAAYNNTLVEITPSAPTVLGKPAGVPFTVTLQKGQIYQLIGAKTSSSEGYQLTGTKVKSLYTGTGYVHPIAVFSGSSRTGGYSTICAGGRDNDIQQHFPKQAWGKKYLTAPMSTSGSVSVFMTNIYKVMVSDPTTQVWKNGVLLSSLVNNSYYEFSSNTADYIEADKPVLVAQFMGGGACLGGSGLGDPEMIYLSPISQGTEQALFYRTNVESISYNYVTLIIPAVGIAALTIDGSSTFDHVYAHPQLSGYSVVVKKWAAAKAQVIVQSDTTFTGVTYGLGAAESYGFNLGTKLNAVNARDASQLPPGFTGDVLLPLQLINFSAIKTNTDVTLRWLTAHQVNVDRFEVERSINGTEFTKVATVVSVSSQDSYGASDKNVLNSFASYSKLYYRLKIIDKDGKLRYSGIAVIKLENTSGFEVNAAPNPFTDKLQLQVQSDIAGIIKINIRDIAGKLIDSRSQQVSKGSSIIEIQSLYNLPKGMYIVEVEMNQVKQHLKVLK